MVEGADLFAAVLLGNAPVRLSAAQVLELIAAAQYFLAEDLLEPLGEYAAPVIAALDIPLVRPTAQPQSSGRLGCAVRDTRRSWGLRVPACRALCFCTWLPPQSAQARLHTCKV